MKKFFDKDYFPSRPRDYIHKRDSIDKINPIFKYAKPYNPVEEKKEEPKKVEDTKKVKM